MTEAIAGRWQEAYDARQAAVRSHPLYPQLFIKTARYAADSYYARKPISHHYRASVGRDCFIGSNDQFWYRRWQQTLIHHDPKSYEQRPPRWVMQEIASKIEQDVYTDEERARGGSWRDRVASVWCTALDDVQARIDGRNPRSTP